MFLCRNDGRKEGSSLSLSLSKNLTESKMSAELGLFFSFSESLVTNPKKKLEHVISPLRDQVIIEAVCVPSESLP